ncbi:MAG: TLC ATP/ADP transporter [Acidobacteria bacterium ADurb.Bin340]|nr:MAG: TLC ATP/ADP transporter [Acidobacteria bacterium ADurb.Bin340]
MQPDSSSPSAPSGFLARLLPVRPGEGLLVALAGSYFFLLLLGYYLLRPLREAFGIARGADKLPLVWTGTLLVMLLANPLYAALAGRFPRRRFIPATYHVFAASLGLFGLGYVLAPGHGGAVLGYGFYIWLSVFNLFVVSVFWALMGDVFDREQGGRLFGLLAIGGTLGALVGSALTERLAHRLDPAWLFLLAALALEAAVACVARLFRRAPSLRAPAPEKEPGPGALEGLGLVGRTRLLQLIAVYMLLFTLTSTFLYVLQGRVVEGAFASQAARTAAFARIDLGVNALTLLTQLFLTHRLVGRAGIPVMLAVLPLVTLGGFGALALWPGFATLAAVQVLRRGLHYAVDRPVREMLYIPLGPGMKYKAKSFIDTFVYRAGDLAGIWMTPILAALAWPLALPALGASLLWLGSAVGLGRKVKAPFKG